eukprot:16443969-Heterocapsa_arctica.AAC.1
MCERNPNTDSGRGPERLLCKGGENICKQKGKGTLTLNQNNKPENHTEHTMVRNIKGSSNSREGHWNEYTKRSTGGGCFRPRRSTWNTDDIGKPDSGEQHHRAQQLCDTDYRHGDENQSRRTRDRSRVYNMLPPQDGPEPKRQAELDHLQPSRALQMQRPTESNGELRDRRPQRGDDQSHWNIEPATILDRGEYEGEDRVYCIFPGNQTDRETDPRKMKKMPFNFFATVEVSQITHVDDVAQGVALRLCMECGNDHYSRFFDQIKGQMDKKRGTKEKLLGTITIRTKAAIIENILGLGHIFKQKGYEELKDMPSIINEMEAELRDSNSENFHHKIRGQRPDRWNDLGIAEENEIMAEAEEEEYFT